MKPNSIETLHQTRTAQNPSHGKKRQGPEQASFAVALRSTIDRRQAGTPPSDPHADHKDMRSGNIKHQDHDSKQDEKTSDTLTAYEIHSVFGFTQSSETAVSTQPDNMNASSAEVSSSVEVSSAEVSSSVASDAKLDTQQALAGNVPGGASEISDKPPAVSGRLSAIQNKDAGKASLLTESTSGRALAEAIAADKNRVPSHQETGSQASQAAVAALEAAALKNKDTAASAAAPISSSGPDAGQLVIEMENTVKGGQRPDVPLAVRQRFGAAAHSVAVTADASAEEPAKTAGGQTQLDQNMDENGPFAAAAGDSFSTAAPSQVSMQTDPAAGDGGLASNSGQNLPAAAATAQAGGLSTAGDPGGSESVSGLDAVHTVFGSDSQQLQLPGQAVASMLLMVRGGQQTLQVRLHPDHLGELQINLARGADGALSARLTADTMAACQLLEANLPQLQQALMERQIVCREIEVQYQQPEQQPGFEQAAGDPNRQGSPDDFDRQSQVSGQTTQNPDRPDERADAAGSESGPVHIRSPYQLDHLV